MWLLLAALAAAAVLLASKKSSASEEGAGTKKPTGPTLDPVALAALNAEPWVPVATDKVPTKPDGSLITAHDALPVGATIEFTMNHGPRLDDGRPHSAQVLGRIVVPHKPGTSATVGEPYVVNIVGILETWRNSPGEALPTVCLGTSGEVCDVYLVTPGKIVSFSPPK